MPELGLKRELSCGFDEALTKIPEALKSEGFGVLTEIDVAEAFKKKLGVDFRRYRILGACNPTLAHKALSANLDVGLMLPCNLIVYEGDGGRAVVAAVDPMRTIAAQEEPQIREVATAVAERLARVLAALD